MSRFSWILIVAVLCDCARDPRAPAATAERRPLVTLPVADAGCYRLDATAPDSVLRLLAALHRWVTLDTTRPAPVGSPFRPGLAWLRDEEGRWFGTQEGYWWRDGRTDTLFVHPRTGFRLVVVGHQPELVGYAYGGGHLDLPPRRYGTVTRRGPAPCAT